MKTKNLVVMALFVGIGAVLHMIIPSAGMKPDFSLLMLFLGILLFPDKKSVLLLGVATGIVSGLTSAFPGGGFLPNLIDKPITAFVFYGLLLLFAKKESVVLNGIMTAIGTFISGTVFLTAALTIAGLPAPFFFLFGTTVLPASVVNTVAMVIIFPIVKKIAVRTRLIDDYAKVS